MNIPLQSWEPNYELAAAMSEPLPPEPHHYVCGDQRRFSAILAANHDTIVVLALRGVPSKAIAAGLGISRSAVDARLHALGMKNPPGVRGKPKKFLPVANRSIHRAAEPAHC